MLDFRYPLLQLKCQISQSLLLDLQIKANKINTFILLVEFVGSRKSCILGWPQIIEEVLNAILSLQTLKRWVLLMRGGGD